MQNEITTFANNLTFNKAIENNVSEKLLYINAIEIKQVVEKNNASFAFPSQSIYVEKK